MRAGYTIYTGELIDTDHPNWVKYCAGAATSIKAALDEGKGLNLQLIEWLKQFHLLYGTDPRVICDALIQEYTIHQITENLVKS